MHFQNIVKTQKDYSEIKRATEISVKILRELRANVKEGLSAWDINELAGKLCDYHKVKPAFLGVPGPQSPFPANICLCVNDEVLHAIPKKERIFQSGDIVKLDFGIIYNGFYTDHCVTLALGEVTDREQALINTGKLCVDTAVKQAVVGNTVADISNALQTVAELGRFNYVTSYCGHGIWKGLHYPPEIPSYVSKYGEQIKLVEGMVLCVENQITLGTSELKLQDDGWTLKTKDGSKGVMFEHMVIVRKGVPEILTIMD